MPDEITIFTFSGGGALSPCTLSALTQQGVPLSGAWGLGGEQVRWEGLQEVGDWAGGWRPSLAWLPLSRKPGALFLGASRPSMVSLWQFGHLFY